MPKPISLNINTERLIAEVAARHRLLLSPNDAAFALVTMNRLVLEEALTDIHARVAEDVALMRSTAQTARQDAESAIAREVRSSAALIHEEIERDLDDAYQQASRLVQEVRATYEKPMCWQRKTIVVLIAVLIFILGRWTGRIFLTQGEPEVSPARAVKVGSYTEELPVTVRDAAVYLGVSPQTVYLWVERKQIPHLRVMGRNIRFLKSDLEPFRATFRQEVGYGKTSEA